MECNECGNDISIVSHKSWCSDYQPSDICSETVQRAREYIMRHSDSIVLNTAADIMSGLLKENAELRTVDTSYKLYQDLIEKAHADGKRKGAEEIFDFINETSDQKDSFETCLVILNHITVKYLNNKSQNKPGGEQ